MALNYSPDPRSPTPGSGLSPAAPAPPRMTLRQARARAISVGFLNQDELFDTFPELGALADDDESSETGSNFQGNNRDYIRDDYNSEVIIKNKTINILYSINNC